MEVGAVPRASSGYMPSLDGIRAIAVALVLFGHLDLSPLIPGGFGVTAFFFLSGYLITALLVREQQDHGSIALKAFYLRRLIRLGPPLAITLAVSTLLVVLGLARGDLSTGALLSQIFFFSNYYGIVSDADSVQGLGVLWSLSVEEHFYLFWPFAFIALARGWAGLRSVAALCVVVLLWRCVRFFVFGDGEMTIYISTDTRIDSMLFGCLLALIEARGLAGRFFPTRWAVPLVAGGVALLLATFLVRDEALRSTLRYSVQGIALMPIFHFAVHRPQMAVFRPLNWKPVRVIGQYSYTLYLIHYVIIYALEYNGLDRSNQLVFVPLATVLSLAYAALVYEFAEKRLKSLRARMTGHEKETAGHGPGMGAGHDSNPHADPGHRGDRLAMAGGSGRSSAGDAGPEHRI